MLPVVDEPAEGAKCRLWHSDVPHGHSCGRAGERHEALCKVDVEDIERFAPSESIINAQVQRKSLFRASSSLATTRVIGEHPGAHRSERRVEEAPLRQFGSMVYKPNVSE